ncbi:alpha/beta fold hydrolase [Tatumella saanichensis]|uniref:alpha/beta fold hydrolase n=1 Tax=Tatumella saanichensis TaxID=480813 RepID=UPI0004A2D570|nr:alpha/beta fold hydrolase [Tatumella saanichensis]
MTATFNPNRFFERFSHHFFDTADLRLHYVAGGEGPPLLLLPGWPQSWYCWRHVMPLLADAGYRVIVPDLRGMGDSTITAEGYDTTTLAADIAALAAACSDQPLDVVGHDVGSWVAYALATDHPQRVKRLVLLDALIPGLPVPAAAGPSPLSAAQQAEKSWHFSFNLLTELPEILLSGREEPYLNWLFDHKTLNSQSINAADRREYLRVNTRPGALTAALGYYRQAFSEPQLAESQRRQHQPLNLPVMTVGAEQGVADKLFSSLASQCSQLQGQVIPNCGHYLPEEAPEALVAELLRFYRQTEEMADE